MNVETARITDLIHHPDNPRIGNVGVIAESLKTNGQYRPVVVSRTTRHIVAGNHTVKAARSLGWKTVDVTYRDMTPDEELAVLLADNRLSDLAITNDAIVTELLQALPDLTGTGYTDAFLRETSPGGDGTPPDPTPDDEQDDTPELRLAHHRARIDLIHYEWWKSQYADIKTKQTIAVLRAALDLPDRPTPEPRVKPTVPRGTSNAGNVPIATLRPHPANPREGDIGAITESLTRFGQYKPIVTTTDGTILAGHHVYYAAHALGWTHLWAVTIEATPEQAIRIMLADNRTSDLGQYDPDQLAATLTRLGTLDGTGYQPDDLPAILAGAPPVPTKTRHTTCIIGDYRWREPSEPLARWATTVTLDTIADRLGIPREALS